MPSGRFALLLLTVAGGVACRSQSVPLAVPDGGAGGLSGAGAGGAGGASAGAGGGLAGAGGGVAGAGGALAGSGGGLAGAGGIGGGGGSSVGGGGGTTVGPYLEAPCDWRGAGHANDLLFTPDGSLLLVAGGRTVRAFDAATGRHVFISPWHPADLFGLASSPDGRWLATFSPGGGYSPSFDGSAAIWRTGAEPSQGRMLVLGESVNAIGFSSDSTLLAVAIQSSPARIAIFELGGLSMVASVSLADLKSGASTLTMSTDGRQLTYQGSTTFTAAGGIPWFGSASPLGATTGPVPNWSDFATASQIEADIGAPQNPEISLTYWNPPATMKGASLGDGVDFSAVALSHGGFLLASGQDNGQVAIWQLPPSGYDQVVVSTVLPPFTTQVGKIPALAFSPDDSLLASASDDGTIYVRRVGDGSVVWHAEGPPPNTYGTSILGASAADGQLLAYSLRGYVVDLAKDVIRDVLDPGPAVDSYAGVSYPTCVGSADAMAMLCPDDLLEYRAADGSQATTGSPAGPLFTTLRGGVALAPDHTRFVESIANPNQNLEADLWSWALPAGASRQLFAHADRQIGKLVFSGDGRTLAGVSTVPVAIPTNALIWAWDAASGGLLGQWGLTIGPDPSTTATDVAISQAGDLIAVVNAYSPEVTVVHPRAGTMQRITPAVDDASKGFGSVAVSPDGTRVAVTSTYNGGTPQGVVPHSVTVFGSDGTTVSRIAGFTTGNIFEMAFLDSKTLLHGEQDGTVSFWCLP